MSSMAVSAMAVKAAGTLGKASTGLVPALDPLELLRLWAEYQRVAETEETKRQAIRVQAEVAIARILADRDILWKLVEQTSKQRMSTLEVLFDLLAKAVENRDDHELDAAAGGIVAIIKTPFDIGFERFRRGIEEDPHFVVELG